MRKINERGLHAGLVKILEGGTYEVKGSEVELFSSILHWVKVDLKKLLDDKNKPKLGKEVIQKDNK